MKKTLTLFLSLFILSTLLLFRTNAAENIKITKIAVKDDSMYIYWDRLVGMTGYNVNVIGNKNVIIEKLIVDKEFNFVEIENYKEKNIKKLEIVGVKSDSSTVTVGYNVQYYNNYPLNTQKVILGAYEEDGYIYPIFNPSLSIKNSNLIINKKTYQVTDGKCKVNRSTGKYTVLAEVILSDGSTVYGTYSGEKIDEKNYLAKEIPCVFSSRGISDTEIAYKIDSKDVLKISFYDVVGNLISTHDVERKDNLYSIELPENAYIAELSIGKENLVDRVRQNGEILPFEISETHIESHKMENIFEGAVNHKETSESSLPYEKLKLMLGKETLADIAINGEVIYKRVSSGDVEDMYLPLSVGDNNISIIVYTLDGKAQTKQFIVSYLKNDNSGLDSILSAPPEIIFSNDYNGKTIVQNSIVFSGSILGGNILNVNDNFIDLDIDMNFSFKANLKPGINKFVFNIYSESNLVYTEAINVTYQMQDMVTNVDTIREIDKQYKYIPDEVPPNELVGVLDTEKSEPSAYDDVLENNLSDLFIPVISLIAIAILVILVIIPYILNKKKDS